jgi:hypothetical protein
MPTQTWRMCHTTRKCEAPGFIKCACDAVTGTTCGAHHTYTPPATYPKRADFETFADMLAARRAFVATCDETTVCPGVPAAA